MRDEGAEMALVLVDKQTVLAIKPQAFFFFFSAASLLPCPSPLSSPFSPHVLSTQSSHPIPPALPSTYSTVLPLQIYASSPSRLHLQWCGAVLWL